MPQTLTVLPDVVVQPLQQLRLIPLRKLLLQLVEEKLLSGLYAADRSDNWQYSEPVREQYHQENCCRDRNENPPRLARSRFRQSDEELVEQLHDRLPTPRHLRELSRRQPSQKHQHQHGRTKHHNRVHELVTADMRNKLRWDLD